MSAMSVDLPPTPPVRRSCSPHTLFHLVPLNADARTALEYNRKFVSKTFDGEYGLEIGYHVADRPGGSVIVRLGRGTDIHLPEISELHISREHASIEMHPESFIIILHSRSKRKATSKIILQTLRHNVLGPLEQLTDDKDGLLLYHKKFKITIASFEFKLVWRRPSTINLQPPRGEGRDFDPLRALAISGYKSSKEAASRLPRDQQPTEYDRSTALSFYKTRLHNAGSWAIKDIKHLRREVGSGAFSIVYQGVEPEKGHALAIKAIRVTQDNAPYIIGLTWREIEIMKSLKHDNLLSIIGYGGFEEGKPEIFLPWMDFDVGKLASNLKQRNDEPALQNLAKIMLKQGLQGLDYLASRGLIHRDVKPANMLCYDFSPLHQDFVVKLSDFGLCQELRIAKTRSGTTIYLAPEFHYEPSIAQNYKWDVWSLFASIAHVSSQIPWFPPPTRDFGWVESFICMQRVMHTFNYRIFEPMVRLHPDCRASAAQMLVHLDGSKAITIGGKPGIADQLLTTSRAMVPPLLPDQSRQFLPHEFTILERRGLPVESPPLRARHPEIPAPLPAPRRQLLQHHRGLNRLDREGEQVILVPAAHELRRRLRSVAPDRRHVAFQLPGRTMEGRIGKSQRKRASTRPRE